MQQPAVQTEKKEGNQNQNWTQSPGFSVFSTCKEIYSVHNKNIFKSHVVIDPIFNPNLELNLNKKIPLTQNYNTQFNEYKKDRANPKKQKKQPLLRCPYHNCQYRYHREGNLQNHLLDHIYWGTDLK